MITNIHLLSIWLVKSSLSVSSDSLQSIHCSPAGSSVHGISQARITEVGCQALLQGTFPTQGSNPGLLLCRWILLPLSHQGSPKSILLPVTTFSKAEGDMWRSEKVDAQMHVSATTHGENGSNKKDCRCQTLVSIGAAATLTYCSRSCNGAATVGSTLAVSDRVKHVIPM